MYSIMYLDTDTWTGLLSSHAESDPLLQVETIIKMAFCRSLSILSLSLSSLLSFSER